MRIESNPTKATDLAAEYARYSRWGILRRRSRARSLGTFWRIVLLVNGIAKRAFDLSAATLILIAFSPLLFLFALLQGASGRALFETYSRLGRWGVRFQLLELKTDAPWGRLVRRIGLHHLPRLINVLRGDMSLIGPHPRSAGELNVGQRAVQKRSSIRPGILSLWWLRKRANINFTSELQVDLEYVDSQSIGGDMGIALRAIPGLLYGSGSAMAPDKVDVLGIPVLNITMEEAVDYILTASRGPASRQICFVNTDCVNKAQKDAAYAALLNASDAVLADGIGIRIAGKILRQEIRQNVNGTDLFPLLCAQLGSSDTAMYLLGGKPGVPEKVRDWVETNYPRTRVSGLNHGYFSQEELPNLLDDIRNSGAQILFVAFGSPKQDIWIAENLSKTGAKVAMGVGGLFDFYSGNIPRAPQWMRELSLEWVFRLMQEPSRMWKRYLLGNVLFLARIMLWMLRRRQISE
jgi:N-acetylglucosaminyldiphosphoundecaprenol N-acetyl-beta-D-mannosaminyltransferase